MDEDGVGGAGDGGGQRVAAPPPQLRHTSRWPQLPHLQVVEAAVAGPVVLLHREMGECQVDGISHRGFDPPRTVPKRIYLSSIGEIVSFNFHQNVFDCVSSSDGRRTHRRLVAVTYSTGPQTE